MQRTVWTAMDLSVESYHHQPLLEAYLVAWEILIWLAVCSLWYQIAPPSSRGDSHRSKCCMCTLNWIIFTAVSNWKLSARAGSAQGFTCPRTSIFRAIRSILASKVLSDTYCYSRLDKPFWITSDTFCCTCNLQQCKSSLTLTSQTFTTSDLLTPVSSFRILIVTPGLIGPCE